MTAVDTDITLADIVNEHPSLARELERLGLDYCCGGGRRLADACAEAGLDDAYVVTHLNEAAVPEPPAEWASMGPVELVDHLLATHHAYLRDELPRISLLAERVEAAHGERHPELHDVRDTWEELRADMEPHLMKEERILFPMVRELAASSSGARPEFHCGTLQNPIRVMEHEHDHVGALLERMRALTLDYSVPDDGCASYRALYEALEEFEADTHQHVHKENNVLFPAVVALESS